MRQVLCDDMAPAASTVQRKGVNEDVITKANEPPPGTRGACGQDGAPWSPGTHPQAALCARMSGPMRTPEITAAISSFELAAEPTCIVYDWDAWPLIRCWLALADAYGKGVRSYKRPAIMSPMPLGMRTIPKTPGWAIRTRGAGFMGVPTQQVAIITHANRTQLLDGKYYRYMGDPFARMLASAGVTAAVWQHGRPAWPQWHAAFFCEAPLYASAAARQLSGRARHIGKEPPWFADIADWHREVFGSPLPWPAVSRVLGSTEAMRQTYASWFKRAGTRLVLTDCWYALTSMAAILGARSVGIPALDLQHGIQGAGHYAYSGWQASDYTTQMCPFPNGFWVWGPRDAEALEKCNAGVLDRHCVFAAGYPWLTEWLAPSNEASLASDAAAAQLGRDSAKVILVTLQDRGHVDEALDLASRSPADWLWLLRVHRGWREASRAVESKAQERGLARVVSVQATDLPLYALLRHSDVHVTWASTCAMEATAFGVPTVLLHEAAEAIFSDYVSSGAMSLAHEGDDAVDVIKAALGSPATDWRAVPEAFSAPLSAERELKRLLSTFPL